MASRGDQLRSTRLRQPEEEQRSLCDWHLFFVLILRVRHLSARSPGSASPVETVHPRCFLIISRKVKFFIKIHKTLAGSKIGLNYHVIGEGL